MVKTVSINDITVGMTKQLMTINDATQRLIAENEIMAKEIGEDKLKELFSPEPKE